MSDASDDVSRLTAVVYADKAEEVFTWLGEQGLNESSYRAMLLAVEGTLPELPADDEEEDDDAKPNGSRNRISREELLTALEPGTHLSRIQLVMVALSTIVAAIGLTRDDVAIIIGAMVIAPLLTPNMALALATTLGDLTMARRSLLTNAAGVGLAFALAVAIGLVYPVDTESQQIVNRTQVSLGDVLLALAAGAAGAISVTSGVSAALVGVMVAVALLPPLVACGLLLGAGQPAAAAGAALLTATNIISVNLAGVVSFVTQGIRPRKWYENDNARRATWIAIALWSLTLAALVVVIIFSQTRD